MIPLIVSFVLMAAAEASAPQIDAETARQVVEALHPGMTVETSEIRSGGVQVHGKLSSPEDGEFPFVLSPRPMVHVEEPEWSVYVFTRREADWQPEDLQDYLKGGPAPMADKVRDAIVLVPRTPNGAVRTYVPDADALWNRIHRVSAGDLTGNGSLQLWVESEALYTADDPREFVGPSMVRLVSIPDFEELFSGVSAKMIIGPELERSMVGDLKVYRMTPREPGGLSEIVLSNKSGDEVERYVYSGSKFRHQVPMPQQRSPEEIAARQKRAEERAKGKTLSIRVVNEAGEPIAGAWVSGTWSKGSSWFNPEATRTSTFRGTTDAEGRFSQSTPEMISVDIKASGYFPERRTWMREQIPDEVVTITLEHAPQAVSMFEWNRGTSWWKVSRDRFSFGVTIAPASPALTNVTEDREISDLWFEITTEDAPDPSEVPQTNDEAAKLVRRNWDMTIYALDGWEIAPGPLEPTGERNDPNMRVAPESGYVSEIHFDSTNNLSLFLHHTPSDRYGIAYKLDFSDHSFPGIGSYGFGLAGLVQEETAGTRSLNPMTYEERHSLTPPEQTPSNPPPK